MFEVFLILYLELIPEEYLSGLWKVTSNAGNTDVGDSIRSIFIPPFIGVQAVFNVVRDCGGFCPYSRTTH